MDCATRADVASEGSPKLKPKASGPMDCMASGGLPPEKAWPLGPEDLPVKGPLREPYQSLSLPPLNSYSTNPSSRYSWHFRCTARSGPSRSGSALQGWWEWGDTLHCAQLCFQPVRVCLACGTVGPPLHSAEVWLLGFSEAGRDQNPWCVSQKRAWETSKPPSPKKSL